MKGSKDRNDQINNQLNYYDYKYRRIAALTPSELLLAYHTSNSHQLAILKAVTISHLNVIYTAVNDYKWKKQNGYKTPMYYALILEDDARFVFDILDWKALINSAPENWNILQLANINFKLIKEYYTKIWSTKHELWTKRRLMTWSAGAYLMNLNSDIVNSLFSNATEQETSTIGSMTISCSILASVINSTHRIHRE